MPFSLFPPIACVLRSIPVGHNLLFIYLRSILILSSLLRILPPSDVLCCRYSGKSLFVYFLTAMRATDSAHLFFDTTKCAVRYCRHWVSVSRTLWWQFLLYLKREKLSGSFWPFERQLTFSRNFCYNLKGSIIALIVDLIE